MGSYSPFLHNIIIREPCGGTRIKWSKPPLRKHKESDRERETESSDTDIGWKRGGRSRFERPTPPDSLRRDDIGLGLSWTTLAKRQS